LVAYLHILIVTTSKIDLTLSMGFFNELTHIFLIIVLINLLVIYISVVYHYSTLILGFNHVIVNLLIISILNHICVLVIDYIVFLFNNYLFFIFVFSFVESH